MSIDATRWAWKLRIPDVEGVKKSSIKLVLLALADRASEDHECWPAARRLHLDTDLDRKTILDAITALIDLGIVEDTGQRRGHGTRVLRLVGVEDRSEPARGTHPENGTGSKNNRSRSRDGTDPVLGMATDPVLGIQNLPMNLKGTLASAPPPPAGFQPRERAEGRTVPYSESNLPAVVAERERPPPEPPAYSSDETAAAHMATIRKTLGLRPEAPQ